MGLAYGFGLCKNHVAKTAAQTPHMSNRPKNPGNLSRQSLSHGFNMLSWALKKNHSTDNQAEYQPKIFNKFLTAKFLTNF